MTDKEKSLFLELTPDFPPVAVKFCFSRPEGVPRSEKKQALCTFVREAQVCGRKFYIDAENEDCVGKVVLGMADFPGFEGSGTVGCDFGVFRTQAANAVLYHKITLLKRGSHNYIIFAPLSDCDFEPDLLFLLTDVKQTDVIIRANGYFSGDLWESRDSYVVGCAWQFAYPFVSGKINHSMTGTHHGQNRRKPYPEGLTLITIPFQKLPEVTRALEEMDRVPIAFREDAESRGELDRRRQRWAEMSCEGPLVK